MMAQQLGHLTGILISLISRPLALPPQLVSSPLGAPVPLLADLFTDYNQTPGDWPTVRLCLFTLRARVCTSELSHRSQEVGLKGSGSRAQGSCRCMRRSQSLKIYGESTDSRGLMRRGREDQSLMSDVHDSSFCQESGVTHWINTGNKTVKSKQLQPT